MTFALGIVKWIALATAVALAIAFALDFTYRRRQLDRIGHLPQLQRMAASLSPGRRALRSVLLAVAVTLAVFALARPQVRGETTWTKRGIDVAVVMDYSKSMLARDIYPSRTKRTEIEVDQLLDELEADRVATVAFAGAAVRFPLTHDHEAARILFRGLTPYDMPPGSNLGEGVMMARCMLRPDLLGDAGCGRGGGGAPASGRDGAAPAPSEPAIADRARAIVLFTDGEDTAGRARREIERAVDLGIEVYVVGVGTTSGELIPERDGTGNERWKKTPDGESLVITRLDASLLRELAQLAGGEGHYFHLDAVHFDIGEVVDQLRRLERGDLDERVVHQPREVYQWLLFPALLLLILEACVSERRRVSRDERGEA